MGVDWLGQGRWVQKTEKVKPVWTGKRRALSDFQGTKDPSLFLLKPLIPRGEQDNLGEAMPVEMPWRRRLGFISTTTRRQAFSVGFANKKEDQLPISQMNPGVCSP